MSLDGHINGAFIPGPNDEELRRVDYIGAFPNLLISLHPDYVMTHRAIPVSPRETWVECAWAFPPDYQFVTMVARGHLGQPLGVRPQPERANA
ncbi:MAG: hypothetical protein FJW80_05015 [Actinobacteria bacterium]|nr:hypothetical protein [Actinomycetota bacterium]